MYLSSFLRRALSALLITLAVSVSVALGAGTTANLTWTAPTQYVDGSALPATDLDHYTITWAPASGQSGPSGSINVAGNLTSATVPVACGITSFTLTVTTTATAKYPNATSGPAGPVSYPTGVSCSPNPPGAFAAK